jgi:hypothetical protein
MNMEVKDRLPGCGATVDTNIIAIGAVVPLYDRLGFINRGNERHVFCDRSLKPRRDMSLRDQECVARRHGESVPQAQHLISAEKNAIF